MRTSVKKIAEFHCVSWTLNLRIFILRTFMLKKFIIKMSILGHLFQEYAKFFGSSCKYSLHVCPLFLENKTNCLFEIQTLMEDGG